MKPEIGYTTDVKVIRVIDGDTVEVEVSKRFHVRLLDCRMPEKKTPEGVRAKSALSNLVNSAKKFILFIPGSSRDLLGDVLTLSRVLGRLWADDVEVSSYMENWFKNEQETTRQVD
jgi:endonuclease YncB( thermonuclease family)